MTIYKIEGIKYKQLFYILPTILSDNELIFTEQFRRQKKVCSMFLGFHLLKKLRGRFNITKKCAYATYLLKLCF